MISRRLPWRWGARWSSCWRWRWRCARAWRASRATRSRSRRGAALLLHVATPLAALTLLFLVRKHAVLVRVHAPLCARGWVERLFPRVQYVRESEWREAWAAEHRVRMPPRSRRLQRRRRSLSSRAYIDCARLQNTEEFSGGGVHATPDPLKRSALWCGWRGAWGRHRNEVMTDDTRPPTHR